MTNFGYEPSCIGWKPRRKKRLASELQALLLRLGHSEPYVEIDGLYPGVRIRKITRLTREELDVLVKASEAIYREVMEVS